MSGMAGIEGGKRASGGMAVLVQGSWESRVRKLREGLVWAER